MRRQRSDFDLSHPARDFFGYRLSSFICAMNQLVMDDVASFSGIERLLPRVTLS